ncbi:CaiB/BaiF CoA transferase family protein [Orrella daihaiensis]|uniref:CoA transferase n=1 Tax=Orrella daihaiensis TaxID=2782176 RepID=A0ABY4AGV3_9BURK|nr:CoA transferase [Orrella daihaiensis]UOD49517.1 CoA transferase [Orrella daihaiensis]
MTEFAKDTTDRHLAVAPFANLTVVEISNSVAAPFAGQIFSELGARLIKVEKPAGDDARGWGPPFWEGASAYFQALNRNKLSVVCDLRQPQEVAALVEFIVEHADIVIQNLRPGQVEKLGIDGATLLQKKPALIYCNLGAFGRVGPLKEKPGYDPLMQAFGGIMSTTGEPGRPAVRVGASLVDMGTGMWAVIGALAAVLERVQTGRGRVVDVSLFETASCWVSLLASQYLASGELAQRQGSGASGIVPYKGYKTLDGELVIAAGSDKLFRALASVLGHERWAEDPRFIDNPNRVKNQVELYALIDPLIAQQSTEHWEQLLDAAGIPCAPVNNLAQMLDHPQTQALGLVQDVPGTQMKFLGLPISFDGQRPAPYAAPPKLGEHNHLLQGNL